MTHDDFLAHLKAREKAMGETRAHWCQMCGPEEINPPETVREMWKAIGAQAAFGAMVSQFKTVQQPVPAVSGEME